MKKDKGGEVGSGGHQSVASSIWGLRPLGAQQGTN